MDIIWNFFGSVQHVIFYVPVFNLLILLYNILGHNLGLAIIGVAVFSRLITLPFTNAQTNNAAKGQDFQAKMAKIRKDFKHNEEKLAQEMAKLQAEFLPSQLGGCLNLIIALMMLIQVRNVVIDLVSKGVHAYNQVAYVETTKFPEDRLSLQLPENLTYGIHELEYQIPATNGNKLTEKVVFAYAEKPENKVDLQKQLDERRPSEADLEQIRKANISLFISQFEKEKFIATSAVTLDAYLRAPSNELIDYDQVKIKLDGQDITTNKISYSQGQRLDLTFLGADLSRVATDYGYGNIAVVTPYVIIAVLVGVTQYFSTEIFMRLSPSVMAQPVKQNQ